MENEGSNTVMLKTTDGIMGWLESAIISSSQTSVGQALFKLIDSFLWVVEKCAQWSLPTHETAADENGKVFGKVDLVRPLPWVLFLPGLVILRIIRCGLNVGAFILRYPPVQPSGMVKFVQKGRRRLRAVNLKAVKSTRRKSTTTKAATPDEKSTTESTESPVHHEMKRKYSQISSDDGNTEESDNETLAAKLERLAMNTSAEDPDFDPTACTDTSSSSTENDHEEISMEELTELHKDMKQISQRIDEKLATSKDEKLLTENLSEENQALLPLFELEDEDRTKSNSKKCESTADDEQRVDSIESKLQSEDRLFMECVKSEMNKGLQPALSELNSTLEVTNGAVPKKQEQTADACELPQARASIAKENSSYERKGYRHKKTGRRY